MGEVSRSSWLPRRVGGRREAIKGSLYDPSLPLSPRAPRVPPRPADLTHPSFTPQIPRASISRRLEPLHRQHPGAWVHTEVPDLSPHVLFHGRPLQGAGACCLSITQGGLTFLTHLSGTCFVTHFFGNCRGSGGHMGREMNKEVPLGLCVQKPRLVSQRLVWEKVRAF